MCYKYCTRTYINFSVHALPVKTFPTVVIYSKHSIVKNTKSLHFLSCIICSLWNYSYTLEMTDLIIMAAGWYLVMIIRWQCVLLRMSWLSWSISLLMNSFHILYPIMVRLYEMFVMFFDVFLFSLCLNFSRIVIFICEVYIYYLQRMSVLCILVRIPFMFSIKTVFFLMHSVRL